MRLTRHDLGATSLTIAALGAYAAHGEDVVFTSTRLTAAVVLVLGAAACAVNGSRTDGVPPGPVTNVFGVLGVGAMVCGIAAVVLGSGGALTGLAVAIGALWLAATVRHLVAPPAVRRI